MGRCPTYSTPPPSTFVILDEATAHLDTTTERAITEALRHHLDHTIRLVIAHRLTTIQAADNIVVLESGRIAE